MDPAPRVGDCPGRAQLPDAIRAGIMAMNKAASVVETKS